MIIKNVKKNWEKMEGSSSRSKKINAYLTSQFISNEAPSDECVSYSEIIAKYANTEENVSRVVAMLNQAFNTGVDLEDSSESPIQLSIKESTLRKIAKKALSL